jgi:superfamily II DNA/RNA helicase
MSPEHRKIYLEAERGFYMEKHDTIQAQGASLVHAQLAANTPEIFPGKAAKMEKPELHDDYAKLQKKNSKLELLLELLEMELADEPVVIYTHLESSLSAIHRSLSKYNPVRITGKESDEERANSRNKFMSGESKIMLLTDAGGESLNLQIARHLVFYSRPWDPGRYVQIVGRIRRFGLESPHVLLWHLTMADSVDEFVDAVITEKFGPYDQIVKGRSGMMPDGEALPLDVAKLARRKRLHGEPD